MLSRFHMVLERTDRQTDRFAISVSRIIMLTRDENYAKSSLALLLVDSVNGQSINGDLLFVSKFLLGLSLNTFW